MLKHLKKEINNEDEAIEKTLDKVFLKYDISIEIRNEYKKIEQEQKKIEQEQKKIEAKKAEAEEKKDSDSESESESDSKSKGQIIKKIIILIHPFIYGIINTKDVNEDIKKKYIKKIFRYIDIKFNIELTKYFKIDSLLIDKYYDIFNCKLNL